MTTRLIQPKACITATGTYVLCNQSCLLLQFDSLRRTQLRLIMHYTQGIIDSTGTETFAKGPKLETLFRELKSTPVRCHKNIHWLLSYVCNTKFPALWCFAAGQHVNGCFSLTLMYFLLTRIDQWPNIIDLWPRAHSRRRQEFNFCVPFRKKRHYLRVSSLLIVFFCLRAPQLTGLSSV